MLDSGVLGRIAHAAPSADAAEWVGRVTSAGHVLIIPEIADYEVRRNLVLHRLSKSLHVLDALVEQFEYVPLTTSVMRRAANLWAEARLRGRPTADPKELDGDVIVASQAIDASATVVTENLGHLAQFVAAVHWRKVATR